MQQRIKLTKRTVDRLESDGRERFYWDTELPGFGLRIRTSGRKYFIVQFRAKGRERRMTLGLYGTITVDAARVLRWPLGAILRATDRWQARRRHRTAKSLPQPAEFVLTRVR